MNKEMEKLVEEIYGKMADFFGGLIVYPEIRVSMNERLAFTERIIALMGKAYADGLPLPNEVGRFKMQHPMNELNDGDTLIALRQEEAS